MKDENDEKITRQGEESDEVVKNHHNVPDQQ